MKHGGNAWVKEIMINYTSILLHKLEKIARFIMLTFLAFYASEKGQREFAEWKAQREKVEQETKAKIKQRHSRAGRHQKW